MMTWRMFGIVACLCVASVSLSAQEDTENGDAEVETQAEVEDSGDRSLVDSYNEGMEIYFRDGGMEGR